MKKLLLTSFLILTTVNLCAACMQDGTTSGAIQLIKPSTGIPDPCASTDGGRRFDSKINKNWDFIASTLTTALTNNSTLRTEINASTRTLAFTASNTNYLTIDTPVSGGGGISTFTWVLRWPGEVFLSTNVFIPLPDAFDNVGKSTINVFEVQSFTNYPSSVGWTSFNVGVCTQTLNFNTTWQYIIQNSTVGTNHRYSVWTSTIFALYPNYAYSLHVTSISTAPGAAASMAGIKLRGWFATNGGN
jgi:hypothetical protein